MKDQLQEIQDLITELKKGIIQENIYYSKHLDEKTKVAIYSMNKKHLQHLNTISQKIKTFINN